MKAKLILLIALFITIASLAIGVSAQGTVPVREPYVTPRYNLINVREGDSTAFRRVAWLRRNESASIIGINSRRTWYQVQLTDGQIGWVGSTVVRVTGSLNDVPVVATTTSTPPHHRANRHRPTQRPECDTAQARTPNPHLWCSVQCVGQYQ